MPLATDPPAALPLTLDLEDFKGDFSFDALFGSLVDELLPEFGGDDAVGPPPPPVLGAAPPVFPAIDELLGLFKHSCKELVDLRRQRLQNLKKEVASQDATHRKTLGEDNTEVFLFSTNPRNKNKIVAKGGLVSKDKTCVVGGDTLGDEYFRVAVHAVTKIGDERLLRPYENIRTIRDAIGCVVAWPRLYVKRAKKIALNQSQNNLDN